MLIKINADGWTAQVIMSDHEQVQHVQARTYGPSQESALIGAKWVIDTFAKGRKAFIRVAPEADTYTDFNSKETTHAGFVRFSFICEPGDWEDSLFKVQRLPLPSATEPVAASFTQTQEITGE